MKLFLFALLLLLIACDATTAADPLPPSVQLGADAIAAGQSAQTAQARSNALSAQATAIAQGTRDALVYRSTSIAQNATATAMIADASATAQARSAFQTATIQAVVRNDAATAQVYRNNTTATAQAERATEAARNAQASATAQAVTGTAVSERATGTVVAIFAAATATRTANQVKEENEQTYWRNTFAPAAQLAWTLLPLGLFLLALRVFMVYEQRSRIVQRGNTIILITPGSLNLRQRKVTPTQFKVITPPTAPRSPLPPASEIAEGEIRFEDPPPAGPPLPPPAPRLDSVPANELKTGSTNEANEKFQRALQILDAALVQLSKARADGEKLTSKPFSFDACHAAGFVQTWEEWGHLMDLWQASGIAKLPRAKAGWEVKVMTLKEGESLLTELYVRTGYVRVNGAWLKR